jgi:methylthioribose-1-phosphate isomerase
VGTALGIITAAHRQGRIARVYVDETRPLLQGARLTAWELVQAGIETVLITDSAAGAVMAAGLVQAVIVGADRIAANGDIANKVGTYTVAVLAHRHGVPFYVAAPRSTIDPSTPSGGGIVIEQRDAAEVTHVAGKRVAPEGVLVYSPAFDVTPNELLTAIVTETGVLLPPFGRSIARL